MLKKIPQLYFFIFTILFFSCNKTPDEAFVQLKNLRGIWKSTGNIIVFDSWKLLNDSTVVGKRYSVNNNKKIFLSFFLIKNLHDSIFFEKKDFNSKENTMNFYSIKTTNKEIMFTNIKNCYPKRIFISYPEDSLYKYRQENIRGNKPVEFKMKRIN